MSKGERCPPLVSDPAVLTPSARALESRLRSGLGGSSVERIVVSTQPLGLGDEVGAIGMEYINTVLFLGT